MIGFAARRQAKFGNVRTEVDGRSFASKKEAKRYQDLVLLQRAGQITDLKLQPRFPIMIGGRLVTTYVGDFAYYERGKLVIEDAKGFQTDVFKIKAALMRAVHGIEVRLT